MKKLLLIRHASAEDTFMKPDIDRNLSVEGQNEPDIVSSKFSNSDFSPDLIKVSPARRTLFTAEKIANCLKWNKDKIEIIDEIYNSDAHVLLKEIIKTSENINNLAIVAHNPAITEVVNFLNNSDFANLAPCTLAYFEFEADNWKNIDFKNLLKFSKTDINS